MLISFAVIPPCGYVLTARLKARRPRPNQRQPKVLFREIDEMKLRSILRWAAVPIASAAAPCLVLFVLITIFPELSYPYAKPVCGSIAAFLFVVPGALIAPRMNRRLALLLFTVGAVLSWPVLSNLNKPDSVTPTYMPMCFTYSSGIVGVLLIFYLRKSISRQMTAVVKTPVE